MSPDIMGVNQSSDLEETLRVVEKYLREGRPVQVHIQDFQRQSEEHDPVEYEVYVDFDEYSQVTYIAPTTYALVDGNGEVVKQGFKSEEAAAEWRDRMAEECSESDVDGWMVAVLDKEGVD